MAGQADVSRYLEQFGKLWFPVFGRGLERRFHATWFLVILSFLVDPRHVHLSQRLLWCARMRSFPKCCGTTLCGLRARANCDGCPKRKACKPLTAYLSQRGFNYRTSALRPDGSRLIAAKAGSFHRMGYLFTHTGIVVICIGGLIDGNIPLKTLQLVGARVPETRDIPQSQVPSQSRLPRQRVFRGTHDTGRAAPTWFSSMSRGYFVQEIRHRRLKKVNRALQNLHTGFRERRRCPGKRRSRVRAYDRVPSAVNMRGSSGELRRRRPPGATAGRFYKPRALCVERASIRLPAQERWASTASNSRFPSIQRQNLGDNSGSSVEVARVSKEFSRTRSGAERSARICAKSAEFSVRLRDAQWPGARDNNYCCRRAEGRGTADGCVRTPRAFRTCAPFEKRKSLHCLCAHLFDAAVDMKFGIACATGHEAVGQ